MCDICNYSIWSIQELMDFNPITKQVILDADGGLDITSQIIKAMNSKKPAFGKLRVGQVKNRQHLNSHAHPGQNAKNDHLVRLICNVRFIPDFSICPISWSSISHKFPFLIAKTCIHLISILCGYPYFEWTDGAILYKTVLSNIDFIWVFFRV